MNIKKWLPALGGGIVVLMVLGWFISVSNDLVSAKQDVDVKWGYVENNMQRRYDLTNQLVGALKGEMHHDDKLIKMVTDARKQYADAKTPSEKMKADAQLSRSTNIVVNVVRENYPQLGSDREFEHLSLSIEGMENRMAYARKEYIDSVKVYNNKVLQFPTSTVAHVKGYHQMAYYHADDAAQKAPKINFGDN